MARARNIKPGFFRNADLVELPFEARLLFVGLWTIADRAGRLEDRPKQIKMELFPADNLDCDALIGQLASIGVLERYEHDGKRYLHITNFAKHQNPHRDEKASTLPGPCGFDANATASSGEHEDGTMQARCEGDGNSVAIGLNPSSLIPDSLIPDPLQSSPASAEASAVGRDRGASAKGRKAGYTAEFEAAWADYPSRPGNSKQDAFKAWGARIKAGVVPSSMHDGVRRYAAYCLAAGTEPRFIKQAATFFGPGEHYLGTWDPPRPQAGKPGATRHNGFDGIDYRKGINDDGTFE